MIEVTLFFKVTVIKYKLTNKFASIRRNTCLSIDKII